MTSLKKLSPFVIMVVCMVFTMLNLFFQILPVSTHEHYKETLTINFSEFAKVLSMYMLAYAASQIPAGLMLDRYGLRYILPSSLFLCLLSYIGFVFATDLGMIGFMRTISGLACSFAYISGVFVASRYFSRKYFAFLLTIIDIVGTLGSVWWESEFHYLIHTLGWMHANSFVIIIIAIIFILSIIFRLEGVESKEELLTFSEIGTAFAKFFESGTILAIFVYMFFTWLVMMSFAGCWIQQYLFHVHHYSLAQCSMVFQVYWWSFMISSIISSKFLSNEANAYIQLPVLALIGFLDFAIMAVPVIFSYSSILLVVIFAGISSAGIFSAFTLGVSLVPKRFSGTMTATINSFLVLGGYIGQVTFGSAVSSREFAHVFKIFTLRHNIHLVDVSYQAAMNLYPFAAFIAALAAFYIVWHKFSLVKSSNSGVVHQLI